MIARGRTGDQEDCRAQLASGVDCRHQRHLARCQHLAEAEQHVALGERHIARQVQIIDELARAGHDLSLAFALLDNYCELQVCHLAHRDRMRKQLGAAR